MNEEEPSGCLDLIRRLTVTNAPPFVAGSARSSGGGSGNGSGELKNKCEKETEAFFPFFPHAADQGLFFRIRQLMQFIWSWKWRSSGLFAAAGLK